MRILILGSSGFLGKNLSNTLKKSKNNTVIEHNSKICNLLSFDNTSKFIKESKADFIINCAGKVGGILSHIGNNYEYLLTNTIINFNLINGLVENDIKNFINVSSSCAYPLNITQPFKEEDYGYSKQFEPTNEGYAISKQLVNQLLTYLKTENNIDFKTIIPCNLYGEYDNFSKTKSHLISAIIMKIHEYKIGKTNEITILGSGNPIRQFSYVKDLCNFITFSIKNYKKLPKNINFASGNSYSVNQYYKKISKIILNKNIKFNYDKSKPDGVLSKNIDNKRLLSLGFKKFTNFDSSVKNTYKYYKNSLND